MDTAKIIKELRESVKMNRKEFSELTGIPVRTLEDWEAGRRTPPEYIPRLIAYQLKYEELVRGKDRVKGAEAATSIHYNVGKEVRTAIKKIGGTMPEDLPTPEKSIQQIEQEQMARLKAKAKNGKIMLDE